MACLKVEWRQTGSTKYKCTLYMSQYNMVSILRVGGGQSPDCERHIRCGEHPSVCVGAQRDAVVGDEAKTVNPRRHPLPTGACAHPVLRAGCLRGTPPEPLPRCRPRCTRAPCDEHNRRETYRYTVSSTTTTVDGPGGATLLTVTSGSPPPPPAPAAVAPAQAWHAYSAGPLMVPVSHSGHTGESKLGLGKAH